jgi:NifU-like protein involved in Fe-S cluster formation
MSGGAERLYTPELLALAVGLAAYPLTDEFTVIGEARSRSCGSTLQMGLIVDDGGGVERIGMRVSACAVGQASAAIFAGEVPGRTVEELKSMLAALESWLAVDGPVPDWPGLDLLVPARAYPGRHGAMLLPWKAAIDALSKQEATG